MHRLGGFLLGLMALVAVTGQALADKRVAFVVGNWDYRTLDRLTTVENDARDMAARLRSIGYEVVEGYNLTRDQFVSKRREFVGILGGSDVAIFYYAGHGAQAEDSNYLLPVDGSVSSINDLRLDGIQVGDIIGDMERSARARVVFLDSYANGPLRGAPSGVTAGFGPVFGSAGSYVATASDIGQATYGSSSRNSPFTAALLQQLEAVGVDVNIMMLDVRRQVEQATGNLQRPWLNSLLTTSVVLNPGGPVDDGERAAWDRIVQSQEIADFEEFLRRYPNGIFADTAREKIRLLQQILDIGERPPGGDAAGDGDGQVPPKVVMDRDTLVRETQRRLIDIGCMTGSVDGSWGPKSGRALDAYERERGLSLVGVQPNEQTLDLLRKEQGRVCPVVCSAREERVGDRCVAKTCPAGQELNSRGACVAIYVPPDCRAGERLVRGRCVVDQPPPPPPPTCGPGERLRGGRCVRADTVSDGCPRGARRHANGHCYFQPICSPANKGLPGTDHCE